MCLFLQDNTFKKIYFVLKLFLMIPTVSISLSLPLSHSLSLFLCLSLNPFTLPTTTFSYTFVNCLLHLLLSNTYYTPGWLNRKKVISAIYNLDL
jgi:hypothetical protein